MAEKFSRLKKLFDYNEKLPEYQADTDWSDSATFHPGHNFPQYERMLENAKDLAIQKKMPNYLKYDFPYDKSKVNRSEPSVLDTISPTPETQNLRQSLHNKNIFLGDPNHELGRSDLNRAIIDQYMKDLHPEYLQNTLTTKTDRMRPGPEQQEILKNYLPRVSQELSGISPENAPPMTIDPYMYGRGAAGEYDLKDHNIKLVSPYDFHAPAHEYLHHADFLNKTDQRSPEFLKPDVGASDDLAKTMHDINNGHISQKLAPQTQETDPYSQNTTYGESAAYYNKIMDLLKNQPK